VALSGLAFSQAMSSLNLSAGVAFLATISSGLVAMSEIGSKSFTTSYLSAYTTPLTTWVTQLPRISV
jgi:hypothetical protein